MLVSSQNQGNPNNYIYFKETENKEIRDGFSNILNSSVDFEDVKSNFTKDEQLSCFISDYGQLPYAVYLTAKNDGTGTRIPIILVSLFQMISKLYQKQLSIWKQWVYLFSRKWEKE